MKKGILILFLIIILTIIFVGCETKKTSQVENRSDVTKITETSNSEGNNTKKSLVNYIGRWHINGDVGVGENEYDRELEITNINDSNVTFNLGFFRITTFDITNAKIENNIAKFTDDYNRISGTLEFNDKGILVSIDKSNFEYVKPEKLNFNSKDQSMKQVFKNKLDTIKGQLDAKGSQVDKEGNTDSGISNYAKDNYEQWDRALNEIYNVLKQSLSADDMKKLQAEEIQWISQKEKAAKDAESEQGQGSQLGYVAYNSTSAKLTKDRCYELVDKYMK